MVTRLCYCRFRNLSAQSSCGGKVRPFLSCGSDVCVCCRHIALVRLSRCWSVQTGRESGDTHAQGDSGSHSYSSHAGVHDFAMGFLRVNNCDATYGSTLTVAGGQFRGSCDARGICASHGQCRPCGRRDGSATPVIGQGRSPVVQILRSRMV